MSYQPIKINSGKLMLCVHIASVIIPFLFLLVQAWSIGRMGVYIEWQKANIRIQERAIEAQQKGTG